MNKITCPFFVLIFLLSFSSVQAQKILPNNLIGKKEIEISASFLGSNYSEIALAEVTGRWPVSKNIKIGGGIKLFYGNLMTPQYNEFNLYPALFADVARFIGKRQKWSISLQPGYEFYKPPVSKIYAGYNPVDGAYSYYSKEKGGFYFSIGGNHRAIVGKRLQIITGVFNSWQSIRTEQFVTYQSNPNQVQKINYNKTHIGLGLKVGIIF